MTCGEHIPEACHALRLEVGEGKCILEVILGES